MNSNFKLKAICWSLLAISTLSAQEPCYVPTINNDLCCISQSTVEFKAGYFFFSDSKMRKVYNKDGLDLQLSASYLLCNLDCRWALNAYGAVEYFQRSGHSINGDEHTSLWAIPVNIGIKPVYTISMNMQYYFAVGPRYFYVHQHNDSPFIYTNRSKNGLGFFVNTGINYTIDDNFFIDLFGEYSYMKTHFHSGDPTVFTRHIQIGGFTVGAGLGYQF